MNYNISELDRVGKWNKIAGKNCGDGVTNPLLIINQIKYIFEEVLGDGELIASKIRNHEHGILDGCGDCLVVAGGLLWLLGVDKFESLPSKIDIEEETSLDDLYDELQFFCASLKDTIENEFKGSDDWLYEVNPVSVANFIIQMVCAIIIKKGYDPEKVLKVVNDSNFTKFCNTLIQANSSVAAYKNKKRYTNVKHNRSKSYWIITGDDATTGAKAKTLKSIFFEEPDFFPMIENKLNEDKV